MVQSDDCRRVAKRHQEEAPQSEGEKCVIVAFSCLCEGDEWEDSVDDESYRRAHYSSDLTFVSTLSSKVTSKKAPESPTETGSKSKSNSTMRSAAIPCDLTRETEPTSKPNAAKPSESSTESKDKSIDNKTSASNPCDLTGEAELIGDESNEEDHCTPNLSSANSCDLIRETESTADQLTTNNKLRLSDG